MDWKSRRVEKHLCGTGSLPESLAVRMNRKLQQFTPTGLSLEDSVLPLSVLALAGRDSVANCLSRPTQVCASADFHDDRLGNTPLQGAAIFPTQQCFFTCVGTL